MGLGFAGDFFVTLVAFGFMTVGPAAFLAAVFLIAFWGVDWMTSSIRRSGLPGSLWVSERVLRVDGGAVAAALPDFAFNF